MSCSEGEKMNKTIIDKNLVPQEIQGWKLQHPMETYDRESIFDYINGAGEVYRAYDFQKAFVYRYAKTDEPEITVEIFDMNSDEDAYGVFSYSREQEKVGIGQNYQFHGNLLCFWQGPYYVCLMAERGTDDTKIVIPVLAAKIDKLLPSSGQKPKMIEYLPSEGLVKQSVRYLHTFPCLNYHYFLASENILKLNSNTDVILGEYQPGPAFLLAIRYESESLADEAYRSFIENYAPEAKKTGVVEIENGKWLNIKREKVYIIIVLDAQALTMAVNLLEAFRDKLISSMQEGGAR
jgi:hypothetical protein